MSITTGISKLPNVSKQFTKMTHVSTKLEWRIDHFEKTMRFYQQDQSISSKNIMLPHLKAIWQLDVYPGGKGGILLSSYFYLRLIGFQAPDGSLSTDGTESIKTDYKIYLLSSTNTESIIKQGHSEFKIDSTEGSYPWPHTIPKFTHPDGSLLVICEIECLVPEETFSMELTPNNDSLNQSIQLADQFKEMWKSQLFTDCTLKVGSKSFPAHKCILGQWSEVFRKMFSLPTIEAESGFVEIEDFSADAISAMLEYMYTGLVKNEEMANVKLCLELLILADKYAVIPLKEMCEVFMASKLTPESILKGAMFADRYSAAKLKTACANRFAIEGRAALQSMEWEDLKSNDKDLANELLELMIKDQPSLGIRRKET